MANSESFIEEIIMEYKSFYLGLVGFFAMVFWALDFFAIYKKSQLFFPWETYSPLHSLKVYSRWILFFLEIISWILISYSLTRPTKVISTGLDPLKIHDVFLVVDVSRSM